MNKEYGDIKYVTKTEMEQEIRKIIGVYIRKNEETLEIIKKYGNQEYIECDQRVYNNILEKLENLKSLMIECAGKIDANKLKIASQNINRRFELIKKLNNEEIDMSQGYLDILSDIPSNMEHFLNLSELNERIEFNKKLNIDNDKIENNIIIQEYQNKKNNKIKELIMNQNKNNKELNMNDINNDVSNNIRYDTKHDIKHDTKYNIEYDIEHYISSVDNYEFKYLEAA